MKTQNLNLDQSEISKFDSLAGDWWEPDGVLKTLHAINPVRLRYIANAVMLNGKSVLDIGCGGGLLSEALARAGAKVTGIDPSEASINAAKAHRHDLNIGYHVSSAEDFAEVGGEKFDIVTCMELLEHVPDPEVLLAAAAKLLKPSGHLFLATINRSLLSYLTAVLAAEYLFGLLPKETHDYAKFIRPSELCAWLRKTGFIILDISGMGYIPGANVAFMANTTAVNYLIHAQIE